MEIASERLVVRVTRRHHVRGCRSAVTDGAISENVVVRSALLGLTLLARSTEVVAQSTPTVIKAKKIYTVTKGTIDNGEILMEGGKIRQVGTSVDARPDAREFTAEVVIPGMIDAHSHIARERGFGRRNRPPSPVTAEWKAVDQFNPGDPMIPIALSGE